MSASTIARTSGGGVGRALLVGLLAGLAAGLLNLVVYGVGVLLGAPFLVVMGPPGGPTAPLPVIAIVVASALPGLGAGLLYWLLGRLGQRGATIFLVVAIVFLLLSFFPVVTMPVELSTRIALAVMHVVAGAAIIWGLRRYVG